MALTDYKIREWDSPIINEANRPKKSAEEMKAAFDSNSNQLRTALNALIDALANGEGGDITMPQLSEGIPAAKLSDQLRAVLEEALEGVRSDDITAIRIGDVGQLEVTFDGAEWVPVAGSGEGGGTDIAALPVAEDIEPPDGFLMYDASLRLPRRALWDKMRNKLSTSFLPAETYASEDPATVKRAAAAVKLETPRKIGNASFDGSEDVPLDSMGVQPASLYLQNVLVEAASWADDATYSEYRYKAAIAIDGVSAGNYAEGTYAPAEQLSGNYAGVVDTYDGGVYVYAKALPPADITIPTIKVEAAGSGNVGGGSGGGGGYVPAPSEDKFVLLNDITLNKAVNSFERSTEDDGTPYNLKRVRIRVSFSEIESEYGAVYYSSNLFSNETKLNNVIHKGRIGVIETGEQYGKVFYEQWWEPLTGTTSDRGEREKGNPKADESVFADFAPITNIKLRFDAQSIKGTIKIYGVRA